MSGSNDQSNQQDDSPQEQSAGAFLMRMVDFKIPLIWLLTGFIIALTSVINMYYQLQTVAKGLEELTISVRAGNSSNSALSGEIALLKFRVANQEAETERIKVAIAQMQHAQARGK